MATKRTPTTKKKSPSSPVRKLATQASRVPGNTIVQSIRTIWFALRQPFIKWWYRNKNFLSRRPHRSFRWTRRRDMPSITPLPSNIFFTSDVFGTIRRYGRSYGVFTIVYIVIFTAVTGIINQDNYQTFSDSIKDIIGGDFGKVGETFTLFTSVITGQLNRSLTETQQIYVGLLSLFTWMSVVWFLRHRLGGASVNVRDALYNSGAPFLPTLMVVIVGMFQLVPGAMGVVAYFAATSTGVVAGGVESMLFAVAAVLLVVLSLYWVTSTIFGLVIVTIPGTYPFRALSLSGDVVVGRRASLLLRLLWMIFMILLIWIFVLVPATRIS